MSSLECKALCIVLVLLSIHLSSSPVYLSEFLPCSFEERSGVSPGIYSLDKISATQFTFEKFSRSSEVLFSYFHFHFGFFYGIRFQYSQLLVIFFLYKSSDAFLILQLHSFRCISYQLFHYKHGTIFKPYFIPISYLYILTVYVRVSSSFFYIFGKSIIFIIIHSLELFPSALADGFSLESEWQQVSSSLQDCS